MDSLLGVNRAPGLKAALRVEAQRTGYKLTLSLDGEGIRGSRELTGNDCAALAETAAWLVAVAIDPGLSLSPPPAPAEPAPVAAPEPAKPTPAPSKPTPLPAEPAVSDWVLHGAVFGGLLHSIENLPVQGDLGLALGTSYRWLSAELRGTASIPSDVTVTEAQRNVRVSNQSLGLAACGLWGSWLRAGPCATFAVYRTHADADLPNDTGPQTVYWAQVLLGAQVSVRLAWPIELFLEGGAGTAVSPRPAFLIGNAEGGRQQELAAARLTGYARGGLRFRWPIARQTRR